LAEEKVDEAHALIGLRGAGKTTLGQVAASRCFIEMDAD